MDIILFVITFVLLIVGELICSDLIEREIVGVASLSVAQKWPGMSKFGRKGGVVCVFNSRATEPYALTMQFPDGFW
jgi:hypothetical protein